jgi:lysozyme family protein
MSRFDQAINIVLKHEGGYVHDPVDPGGETKYGISKARYPNLDIYSLTKQMAKAIYKSDFWDKNNLGKINSQPVANFALDTVVHHGYGPKLLQETANKLGANLVVDGIIGPKTLNAINSIHGGLFLITGVERRKKYMSDWINKNPAREKYRRGFMQRASFFLPDGLGFGKIPVWILGIGAYIFYKFFKRK